MNKFAKKLKAKSLRLVGKTLEYRRGISVVIKTDKRMIVIQLKYFLITVLTISCIYELYVGMNLNFQAIGI
jgi:hypothetical protein